MCDREFMEEKMDTNHQRHNGNQGRPGIHPPVPPEEEAVHQYERRPPRNPEELYRLAKETVAAGKRILMISDYDHTKSRAIGDGSTPFQSEVDPACGQAELRLDENDVGIATLSNRSAEQIATRYEQLHFTHPPFVVGTYGAEIRTPTGESIIDARWEPYRDIITAVLGAVRQTVLHDYGVHPAPAAEVTIENGQGAPIYLEMKGLGGRGTHGVYSEGLAHTYGFDHVSPEARTRLVAELDAVVERTLEHFAEYDAERVRALREMWGGDAAARRAGTATAPGKFAWNLEPLLKRNKAWGMTRLLRAVAESGFHEPVGLVMYAGDHPDQDGQAMWAGKIVERSRKGQGIRFAGILVHDGHTTREGQNDLSVEGVAGYARFLEGFAQVVQEAKPHLSQQPLPQQQSSRSMIHMSPAV
jgi:hypothetical protein